MKTEPIIPEAGTVKERLAERAGGDLGQFLAQMDAWLAKYPHPGPSVGSPDELQERLRHREATEPPPPGGPYRNHDPIIAEVHRIREKLYREREAAPYPLKDQPPEDSGNSTSRSS